MDLLDTSVGFYKADEFAQLVQELMDEGFHQLDAVKMTLVREREDAYQYDVWLHNVSFSFHAR